MTDLMDLSKECIYYATIIDLNGPEISTLAEAKHRKKFRRYFSDEIMRKIDEINCRKMSPLRLNSYQHSEHIIFLYKYNNYLYACITSKKFQKRISDYFLTSLAKDHHEKGSMNDLAEAKILLQDHFNRAIDPLNEPYNLARHELKKLLTSVQHSIEEAYARGSQIDTLQDTTAAISQTAYTAKSKSKKLRQTTEGNVIKYYIITVIIVIMLLSSVGIVAFFKFGGTKLFGGVASSGSGAKTAPAPKKELETFAELVTEEMKIKDELTPTTVKEMHELYKQGAIFTSTDEDDLDYEALFGE